MSVVSPSSRKESYICCTGNHPLIDDLQESRQVGDSRIRLYRPGRYHIIRQQHGAHADRPGAGDVVNGTVADHDRVLELDGKPREDRLEGLPMGLGMGQFAGIDVV